MLLRSWVTLFHFVSRCKGRQFSYRTTFVFTFLNYVSKIHFMLEQEKGNACERFNTNERTNKWDNGFRMFYKVPLDVRASEVECTDCTFVWDKTEDCVEARREDEKPLLMVNVSETYLSQLAKKCGKATRCLMHFSFANIWCCGAENILRYCFNWLGCL